MPILTRSVVHPSRRFWGRLVLASVLTAIVLSPATAGSESARAGRTHEYDLKAVFLFQFAHFVTWPARSFRDETTPITIGVLGEDPFGAALDEVVAGESVGTRRLDVRRYQLAEQVGACHILFISASEADHLPAVLAGLRGRNVLTVGDTKDFATRGGIVGFGVDRNRVKLRVNLAAADSAQLTISSKLLRQAEVVRKGAKR
ncbi:MAG TPA: YfiR family protein [Candidatus Eisenbacteria bacterium]|nr:YfiR family protein [Candidatus Eisenbacteria bacterium]